jgi:hypothetical protein
MTTRPDANTPEPPQKATERGLSASEGSSGQRETLRGQNGAQRGAGSLDGHPKPRGPVDWARQQAAEREAQAAVDPAWDTLRARAFNAVQPALRQAGEWLPLSARRAVADAVLAELKRELDAFAEYEGAINWMTTCTSCARVLDSAYAETVRAERAEATIGRVRKLGAELFVDGATHTHRAIGRQILNALQAPGDGETTPADEARLDRAHWEAKYAGEGQ